MWSWTRIESQFNVRLWKSKDNSIPYSSNDIDKLKTSSYLHCSYRLSPSIPPPVLYTMTTQKAIKWTKIKSCEEWGSDPRPRDEIKSGAVDRRPVIMMTILITQTFLFKSKRFVGQYPLSIPPTPRTGLFMHDRITIGGASVEVEGFREEQRIGMKRCEHRAFRRVPVPLKNEMALSLVTSNCTFCGGLAMSKYSRVN